MARHQSAIRQHRRSVRRTAINKRNKTILKSQARALRTKIQSGDKDSVEKMLPGMMSAADKAAKKKAVHRNKAARLKSRLSRKARTVNPSPSA